MKTKTEAPQKRPSPPAKPPKSLSPFEIVSARSALSPIVVYSALDLTMHHPKVKLIRVAQRRLLSEPLQLILLPVVVGCSQLVVLALLEEAELVAGGGLGALAVRALLHHVLQTARGHGESEREGSDERARETEWTGHDLEFCPVL